MSNNVFLVKNGVKHIFAVDHYYSCTSCFYFLYVAHSLFVKTVLSCDCNHRHSIFNKRYSAVLQLAGGIAFGVDI